MMKRMIINILLKCLNRLDYFPVYFREIEINKTELERFEIGIDHEIKYPQYEPGFDKYVACAKNAIPYEMSKKMTEVIEKNMLCEVSEPNQFSPYPTIQARIEIYIKPKQDG